MLILIFIKIDIIFDEFIILIVFDILVILIWFVFIDRKLGFIIEGFVFLNLCRIVIKDDL